MRTKNILWHLILGALLLPTGKLVGQSTTPGNVANLNTDFLGWNTNAANNFPLMVRHDLNQPIEWWTNSDRRMFLTEELINQTINSYPNIDMSGFIGLGQFSSTQVPRPFTFLHIDDGGGQDSGFRPWMRVGATMTRGSDLSYFGIKDESAISSNNDRNHTVIAWADNTPGSDGADLLKFIFLSNNVGNSIAASENGLEVARFRTESTGNEGYFGIGDWFTAGVGPTERLDILDRTIRIRRLVPDYHDDNLTHVVMSDANGLLHWKDINTFPTSVNCDWRVNDPVGNVTTAVANAFGCPDETYNLGVGTDTPNNGYKLHVYTDEPDDSYAKGAWFEVNGDATGWTTALYASAEANGAYTGTLHMGANTEAFNATSQNIGMNGKAEVNNSSISNNTNIGVFGEAVNPAGSVSYAYGLKGLASGAGSRTHSYGLHAQSTGGTTCYGTYARGDGTVGATNTSYGTWAVADDGANYNYGLRSQATGPSTSIYNYGLHAVGSSSGSSATNYGVYANATGGAVRWAGWFQGDVMINGTGWLPGGVQIISDASFKTNVEDVMNATSTLVLLAPKTYQFLTADHPGISLPTGDQLGFLAQEVEQVIPEMVKEVTIPAEYDSLGVEVTPEETVKTLNYIALIPLLVASIKEQQTQLAAMQQQLNNCCTLDDDVLFPRTGQEGGALQEGSNDLKIAPNPFDEATTLSYTLAREGQVRLEVSDAHGRLHSELLTGQHERGTYQHIWNTQDLTPGTYYVSLWLEQELIVKRAVRVAR